MKYLLGTGSMIALLAVAGTAHAAVITCRPVVYYGVNHRTNIMDGRNSQYTYTWGMTIRLKKFVDGREAGFLDVPDSGARSPQPINTNTLDRNGAIREVNAIARQQARIVGNDACRGALRPEPEWEITGGYDSLAQQLPSNPQVAGGKCSGTIEYGGIKRTGYKTVTARFRSLVKSSSGQWVVPAQWVESQSFQLSKVGVPVSDTTVMQAAEGAAQAEAQGLKAYNQQCRGGADIRLIRGRVEVVAY